MFCLQLLQHYGTFSLNTNVLLPKIVTCIVSNITNCMTSDILTIILVLRGIVKQLHFKLEQTYVS